MNGNPIQFLMQLMNLGNNPNAIINTFIQQNPNAKAIYQSMINSGMTPQQYLTQYANQNNMGNVVNNMQSFLNSRNRK